MSQPITPSPDADALRRLFDRAMALDEPARSELLGHADRDHPDLAREVRALLRHALADDELLDRSPIQAAGLHVAPAFSSAAAAHAASAALHREQVDGALPIGTILSAAHPAQPSRWQITGLIARGSATTLYDVEPAGAGGFDPPGSPRWLMRLVRPELVTDTMLARFAAQSAGTAAPAAPLTSLAHPGLLPTRQVGLAHIGTPDPSHTTAPRPYLIRERTDDTPLLDHPPLRSPAAIAAAIAQVCDALHHAHTSGVHHLALSPRDLTADAALSRIRIADIGLCQLIDGPPAPAPAPERRGTRLFSAGLGAAAGPWSAPEQRDGSPSPDPVRIDVFAAGMALRDLLAQMPAQARVSPSPLDPILRCATAPDPAHRYSTCAEMAADLRAALTELHSAAARTAALARTRRRRTLQLIALTTAATLAGAGVRWLLSRN